MKTARWWSVAFLLLGLAVLGNNGRPNKEGFGSPPYRPVMKFRHKVLIALIFNLLCATRRHFVFAKFEGTIAIGAILMHGMTLVFFVFPFCHLKYIKRQIIIPPIVPGGIISKDFRWCEACLSKEKMFS